MTVRVRVRLLLFSALYTAFFGMGCTTPRTVTTTGTSGVVIQRPATTIEIQDYYSAYAAALKAYYDDEPLVAVELDEQGRVRRFTVNPQRKAPAIPRVPTQGELVVKGMAEAGKLATRVVGFAAGAYAIDRIMDAVGDDSSSTRTETTVLTSNNSETDTEIQQNDNRVDNTSTVTNTDNSDNSAASNVNETTTISSEDNDVVTETTEDNDTSTSTVTTTTTTTTETDTDTRACDNIGNDCVISQ